LFQTCFATFLKTSFFPLIPKNFSKKRRSKSEKKGEEEMQSNQPSNHRPKIHPKPTTSLLLFIVFFVGTEAHPSMPRTSRGGWDGRGTSSSSYKILLSRLEPNPSAFPYFFPSSAAASVFPSRAHFSAPAAQR
jgi:hypothetical protein